MDRVEILTAADMTGTDRRTITECGVPMSALMANAGAAVARFLERRYPEAKRLLFLCGKGNYGGDWIVAAKVLAATGDREITVAILGKISDLKETPAMELKALRAAAPHVEVASMKDGSLPEFAAFDLIVDAIVGTGFKPPLKGLGAEIRDRVALLSGRLSSRLTFPPAGMRTRSEQKSPDAFRADAVVTFTAPKLAHVFGALTRGNVFGPVVVAGIGSPDAGHCQVRGNLHWGGASKTIAEDASGTSTRIRASLDMSCWWVGHMERRARLRCLHSRQCGPGPD